MEGLERCRGLIIVTGPSGSGKSSTLVSLLQSAIKPTLSVVSVEDPVKYVIDGVRQVKLGYKLGVVPFLIAQGLNLIIAQRLVRKLCERCKEPVPHVNDHLLARLGFTQEESEHTRFFRAVGCINCIGGCRGRVPIFETLLNTPDVEEAILNSWDGLHIDALHEPGSRQGMRPLRDSGIGLLKRGVTTIDEVASATA